jgi:MFS family permease
MSVGAATGPVYDAGYFRVLLITGTFLIAFGHMMLSLCEVYWQVLMAQGICIGLGAGVLLLPGVAILSTYFTTKISLALGIAASGSSIGGVIFPIIFRKLQPQIGFGWSVRITGFIILGTLFIPNAVMKVRVLPASRRKVIDWSAFTELPYTLFNLGLFLAFMGLFTPFYYIQLFAIERRITNYNLGFHLLPIINAASTFGRIIPNFLADKTGAFNMMVPCALLSGVLILCLLSISSPVSILVFCILFGFFSGSFVSLQPSILVFLSPNRGIIGTRMGMSFTILAISLLIGTPIAGAILDAAGYRAVWSYGGVLTLAGSATIGLARGFSVGWKLNVKV